MFDRSNSLLDAAGSVLLGVIALLVAALAVAGVPLALAALPFATGAVVGDGLVYAAILHNEWRNPVLLVTSFVFLVVLSGFLLSGLGASAPWIFWEPEDLAWKLAFGFLLGFGVMVLPRSPWFPSTAPASWEESIGQRRDLVHATLVVGGLLLALLAVISAVFGALALIAYAVGHLAD